MANIRFRSAPVSLAGYVQEGVATGGVILGDASPDAAGELGYAAAVLSLHDGTASRAVALLESTRVYLVDALPVAWFIDGGTAPGAVTTLASTNKAKYRDFANGADNDVFVEWMVPYGIDATVAPVFQVEGWVTNAIGPAQTETIKFALQGASYGDSDILSGALGTAVTVTYTEPTPATHLQYDRLITGFSTAVTITGLAAGELVILNLKRDTTDTYEQAFGVGWLKIKYAIKLQGS